MEVPSDTVRCVNTSLTGTVVLGWVEHLKPLSSARKWFSRIWSLCEKSSGQGKKNVFIPAVKSAEGVGWHVSHRQRVTFLKINTDSMLSHKYTCLLPDKCHDVYSLPMWGACIWICHFLNEFLKKYIHLSELYFIQFCLCLLLKKNLFFIRSNQFKQH